MSPKDTSAALPRFNSWPSSGCQFAAKCRLRNTVVMGPPTCQGELAPSCHVGVRHLGSEPVDTSVLILTLALSLCLSNKLCKLLLQSMVIKLLIAGTIGAAGLPASADPDRCHLSLRRNGSEDTAMELLSSLLLGNAWCQPGACCPWPSQTAFSLSQLHTFSDQMLH